MRTENPWWSCADFLGGNGRTYHSIRRQRSADEQMPFVQEGASRHGADGHANHLAAMMWEWRRPDEIALSRKPLSNGSKTGLLERQFDRVINHARVE